mmetsp:Transcript_13194/g.37123  ORF Transcript_13194/g.37123 Transcript_13194/m.37123 type:complete len:232 (-) Transcript_13194:2193-2888(-)
MQTSDPKGQDHVGIHSLFQVPGGACRVRPGGQRRVRPTGIGHERGTTAGLQRGGNQTRETRNARGRRMARFGTRGPANCRFLPGSLGVGRRRSRAFGPERRTGPNRSSVLGFLPGDDGRHRPLRGFESAAGCRRLLSGKHRVRSTEPVSAGQGGTRKDEAGRDQARAGGNARRGWIRLGRVRHEHGGSGRHPHLVSAHHGNDGRGSFGYLPAVKNLAFLRAMTSFIKGRFE